MPFIKGIIGFNASSNWVYSFSVAEGKASATRGKSCFNLNLSKTMLTKADINL